jgi:hypothetical protein
MSLRRSLLLALGLLLVGAYAPAAAADIPETVRWSSTVGEVVFPHLRHTEEFGAECVACHHETVAANLAVPHPSYFDDFWVDCKVCHTGSAVPAAENRCGACHPDRPSGLNQEMLTAKVAIHRSCWSCHDRGIGSEASKQCLFCHQRPPSPRPESTPQVQAQPQAPAVTPAGK